MNLLLFVHKGMNPAKIKVTSHSNFSLINAFALTMTLARYELQPNNFKLNSRF